MPFSGPSAAAAASSAFTSSGLVARLTSNTQSVIDELVSGTRTAKPFSLPLSSGKMSAMAVALPVLVGARLLLQITSVIVVDKTCMTVNMTK